MAAGAGIELLAVVARVRGLQPLSHRADWDVGGFALGPRHGVQS
jgi:hypothetical protein